MPIMVTTMAVSHEFHFTPNFFCPSCVSFITFMQLCFSSSDTARPHPESFSGGYRRWRWKFTQQRSVRKLISTCPPDTDLWHFWLTSVCRINQFWVSQSFVTDCFAFQALVPRLWRPSLKCWSDCAPLVVRDYLCACVCECIHAASLFASKSNLWVPGDWEWIDIRDISEASG